MKSSNDLLQPSFSPLVQEVNHVVQKIFFRKYNNLTPLKFSRSALLSSARFFEFRALETWFVYKTRGFVGPELKFMSMRVAFDSGVVAANYYNPIHTLISLYNKLG